MATRKQIRDRLKALMDAEIVGAGHVLQVAHGPVGDASGAWPMAMIGAEGSTLPAPTNMGRGSAQHRLRVQVFVKYAEIDDEGKLVLDDSGQPVWTEEDAADALDGFQVEFDAFIMAHKSDTYWLAVTYEPGDNIEIVDVGGVSYLSEPYRLTFTTN